jgi:hypothetical protein
VSTALFYVEPEILDQDVEAVVLYVQSNQITITARPQSLVNVPACVVGAVFSMGVRPAAWQKAILRLQSSGWPTRERFASFDDSCANFLQLFDCSSLASVTNSQRTSAKSGILKAEASIRFVQCLSNSGIERFNDLNDTNKLKHAFREIGNIPGQSSGISFMWFLMLSGLKQYVKPDRRIMAFLNQKVGIDLSDPKVAAAIVRKAAQRLRCNASDLDYTLFNSQGNQFTEC